MQCECGQWSGEQCAADVPEDQLVVVEFMPEHLRVSHEAAGNRGVWPFNGAERVWATRECAKLMVESDEWAFVGE